MPKLHTYQNVWAERIGWGWVAAFAAAALLAGAVFGYVVVSDYLRVRGGP
ncbi:MAG TPA: hypothetical protein VF615_05910 [Longimicrobiaceae bacterium]|jgi:hypothetical protein